MRSWNLLFATRVTVAEALSWGSKVVPLDANGDPLSPSALSWVATKVSPLAGVLAIDAEIYARLTEIERRHHNRVSTLQRRVRRARASRERAERLLSERDATIHTQRENEKRLLATISELAAQRDALQAAADERNEPAMVSAKPSPLYSKDEAEARGFTVDTTCYPWVGYKGPRFDPTVVIDVVTPGVPHA